MSGSIIIPAHNEAAVIGRCLRHIQEGLGQQEVHVVVVANGCSDATAAAARAAAPSARVLEIAQASKPEAIRVGERASALMPRLYVDADVQLSGTAALATLRALSAGAVAARPPIQYDSAGATWPVRSYYRARSLMPSLHSHAWGAGVYGLSDAGRQRFDEFPDVVGDDLLVDLLLAPGELAIVDADPVVVTTPRDSRRLLRILRRAQKAKREDLGGVALPEETEASTMRDLRLVVLSRPLGIGDALVFAAFAIAARISSRRPTTHWERDDSSR